MNFKDFCKTEQSKNVNNSKINPSNEERFNPNNNIDIDNITQKANEYSKLSNSDLVSEFLKEARKKKGGYSSEEIRNLQNLLFPMLNEDQKKYFNELMNMVK